MIAEGEECELQQLVPSEDDDSRVAGKSGEVTPPVTPVCKVTEPSPRPKEKMSTRSAGGSVPGTTASQGSITGSRSLVRIATAPLIDGASSSQATGGSNAGSQPTRLLFVNEKVSRTPSLMSDKQVREHHHVPHSSRIHSKKRDVTDVRHMETALLQLLEDFHSGKLRAFGKDCSMEQMTGIREQQERLARLHFDLGAQQELYAPLSEEGLRADQENKHRLMDSLEQLSMSIEQLHSFSSDSREGSLKDKT